MLFESHSERSIEGTFHGGGRRLSIAHGSVAITDREQATRVEHGQVHGRSFGDLGVAHTSTKHAFVVAAPGLLPRGYANASYHRAYWHDDAVVEDHALRSDPHAGFTKRRDTFAKWTATRGRTDPSVVQRQSHIEHLNLERIAWFGPLDGDRTRHRREYCHRLRRGVGPCIRGETVVGLHHKWLPRLDPEDRRILGAKTDAALIPGGALQACFPSFCCAFPSGVALPQAVIRAHGGQESRESSCGYAPR